MSNARFPIRTVASLTGVNAITLRAWERRHGLLRPERTESGHRLYSHDDIDTIHRVTAMLQKGISIAQAVASLESSASPAPAARVPREVSGDHWAAHRESMVAAISVFDENRLEDIYNDVLAVHPTMTVTKHLLLPLLAQLGRRWETAEGSVAEEHFFSVFLRNKLGARFHHRPRIVKGPRLLATCLAGERHEIGLLLFSLAAHEQGFQVILLGGDMPIAELGVAAHRARADAIVLSASLDPDTSLLDRELPALVKQAGVPVFIGGLTSVRSHDRLVAAGAEPLGADIHVGIRRLYERFLQ